MLSIHPSFVCFSIEAIDTWIERRLMSSLKSSPFFSLLADECQDVSTQEEPVMDILKSTS